MRERLETKIEEVIETILAKDPVNITYNEYRILDSKLSAIKWEDEQKNRNKELLEVMAKTFGTGFGSPTTLPEE